jgi:hypothetical protein
LVTELLKSIHIDYKEDALVLIELIQFVHSEKWTSLSLKEDFRKIISKLKVDTNFWKKYEKLISNLSFVFLFKNKDLVLNQPIKSLSNFQENEFQNFEQTLLKLQKDFSFSTPTLLINIGVRP